MKTFQGKKKALTFSYDDAVLQDRRLIGILDKYGMKGTFNLNSGCLGMSGALNVDGHTCAHVKFRPDEVREIYRGHEIAVHTLTHPNLKLLDDAEVIRQVEEDRLALSELAGYEVVGMAYPGGSGCYDERVIELIRQNTGVKYSRGTTSSGNFEPQTELLDFKPTVHTWDNWDEMFRLGREFIEMQPETPQLFYIWGHAYEFDSHDDWDALEAFCHMMAHHDDIFYGTNKEVLL